MEEKHPLLILELADQAGNRANLNLPISLLQFLTETGGLELLAGFAQPGQLEGLDFKNIVRQAADGVRGEVIRLTRKDGVSVVGKVEDR